MHAKHIVPDDSYGRVWYGPVGRFVLFAVCLSARRSVCLAGCLSVYVCLLCMHAFMYECAHVCVCVRVCVCVCVCVLTILYNISMYVRMNVCAIYAYISICVCVFMFAHA